MASRSRAHRREQVRRAELLVGCAGWSIPAANRTAFGDGGSHLQRYAAVFRAAEINSSFHRPHRAETYARWAASVPEGFRFSVKLPGTITHERRLVGAVALLEEFLAQVAGLGPTLGCLLVQLPPSLAHEAAAAGRFLKALRARHDGAVALEPRHPSWFLRAATTQLLRHRVARVAADPARVPAAAEPGGDPRVVYIRLHGSPRMYWSGYDRLALQALAGHLRDAAARAEQVWCVFDNTASGAATSDALALQTLLAAMPADPPPRPVTRATATRTTATRATAARTTATRATATRATATRATATRATAARGTATRDTAARVRKTRARSRAK